MRASRRTATSEIVPAGTISLVAVLRDARILRQAQERTPQDEANGFISRRRAKTRIALSSQYRRPALAPVLKVAPEPGRGHRAHMSAIHRAGLPASTSPPSVTERWAWAQALGSMVIVAAARSARRSVRAASDPRPALAIDMRLGGRLPAIPASRLRR